MIKAHAFILVCFVLFSCSPSGEKEQNGLVQDSMKTGEAAQLWGTYKAVLPCADCEGISTILIIDSTYTYKLISIYLGKSDSVFEEHGSYSLNNDSNIIVLMGEDNKRIDLFKVEDNRLRKLDVKGNEVTGLLQDHYILHKNY